MLEAPIRRLPDIIIGAYKELCIRFAQHKRPLMGIHTFVVLMVPGPWMARARKRGPSAAKPAALEGLSANNRPGDWIPKDPLARHGHASGNSSNANWAMKKRLRLHSGCCKEEAS